MELPDEHGLIWEAIYRHPGEENATKARVILLEADLRMSGGRLRDVVHELRTVYHLPAGSNPRGYFRMVTTREFASQRRRLRRRALRIMAAAAGVRRAWRKFDEDRRSSRDRGEQERLEYASGTPALPDEGPVAQQVERRAQPSPRVARRPRLETARAQSGGS